MIDIQETFNEIGESGEDTNFKAIQDPPFPYRDLCAFALLVKLVPADAKAYDFIVAAKHDQIWLATDCEELEKVASRDDLLYLYRCGVFFDEYVESLSMFA